MITDNIRRRMRNIEMVYQKNNIPVLSVFETDSTRYMDEVPFVQLIIPMNIEIEVFQILELNRIEINRQMIPAQKILVRTILYYLAYEIFARLASNGEGIFTSANITNLKNPRKKKDRTKNRIFYYYDVDLLFINEGSSIIDQTAVTVRAIELVRNFNALTGFLKIENFRTGFSSSRAQFAHSPPLEFRLVYSEKT